MADKSALEQIAKLKAQMDKLAEEGRKELLEERKGYEEKIATIDEQLAELGYSRNTSSKGKKKEAAEYTGSATTVLKYISENAGERGVATRSLTAQFGKPDNGWDAFLDGKATLKGKGPAGRWFAK